MAKPCFCAVSKQLSIAVRLPVTEVMTCRLMIRVIYGIRHPATLACTYSRHRAVLLTIRIFVICVVTKDMGMRSCILFAALANTRFGLLIFIDNIVLEIVNMLF